MRGPLRHEGLQAGLFELCHRLCTPLHCSAVCSLPTGLTKYPSVPVVPQAPLLLLHQLEMAELISYHRLPPGHRGEVLPEDARCPRGIKSAEIVHRQVLGSRKGSSAESLIAWRKRRLCSPSGLVSCVQSGFGGELVPMRKSARCDWAGSLCPTPWQQMLSIFLVSSPRISELTGEISCQLLC